MILYFYCCISACVLLCCFILICKIKLKRIKKTLSFNQTSIAILGTSCSGKTTFITTVLENIFCHEFLSSNMVCSYLWVIIL